MLFLSDGHKTESDLLFFSVTFLFDQKYHICYLHTLFQKYSFENYQTSFISDDVIEKLDLLSNTGNTSVQQNAHDNSDHCVLRSATGYVRDDGFEVLSQEGTKGTQNEYCMDDI